ncbi:MAG: TIR domain-containing protein [Clostridia bacterium]|nr:TIR domain-containing protein [Clostridia bacterium]
MERTYMAFISYKHAPRDAAIAKQVHTLIENYIIPKSLRKDGKKLGIVFRDEEELPISSDLTESICTALDASRHLIVICSPEARESPWVAREINYFLEHHDAEDAFVVLADGEPGDVFPRQLTHVLNKVTGQYQDVEPLALDVRADTIASSLKKTKAQIKKLYAGMLGCSYDGLVQREKTRRMKRIGALAALSLLLAGSFIGMLFAKNQQLTQKNQQLTAAIELALNRESGLLAGKAEEAIKNGDAAEAMKHASNALYSPEMERPYYAPAERVLFQTVDVLEERSDTLLLTKTALPHHSPIEKMAFNADGSRLFSIDMYGTVSSFDAASGLLLWEAKLPEHEDIYRIENADPQLFYDEKSGLIICYYDGILSGLQAATGHTAWQTNFDIKIESGLYFEEESQKIGYIESRYFSAFQKDVTDPRYEYSFVTLSARDGSLQQRIPLLKRSVTYELYDGTAFDRDYQAGTSGAFLSPDLFTGSVFNTEKGISQALLYTIDLQAESLSLIPNDGLTSAYDFLRTFALGKDQALVVSCRNHQTLHLQCFDVKKGSLLWENSFDLANYLAANEKCLAVSDQTGVVLAVANQLIVLDKASGKIKASGETDADIIALYLMDHGLFGYAQEDGYCAAAWSNASGLHDSNFYSAIVNLPDTPEMLFFRDGLIRAHISDNRIQGFVMPALEEGGGSIAYLAEDRCTAYVASVLPNPVLPEAVTVKTEGALTTDPGNFICLNSQGQALLGPVWQDTGFLLNVVDTNAQSMASIRMEGNFADYDQYYLTGDGKHLLACSDEKGICRIGLDGSITPLSEKEVIVMTATEDFNLLATLSRADAVQLAAGGKILSAQSSNHTLTYWLDGENAISVPLPQDVHPVSRNDLDLFSMLHTGKNGLIILSGFASEDIREMEQFIVYDLAAEKWIRIPDAARGTDDRLMAFGEKLPLFAVYDQDKCIRVYDSKTAGLFCTIPVGMHPVSILKTGILLDDQYVYLLTRDGQFMVYQMDTQQLVFRTLFSGSVDARAFSVWPDQQNNRLYIRSGLNGLCVDTRSWEDLFTIKDFKFFDAKQNKVYVCRYDVNTNQYRLMAFAIPATSQLIDIVQDTLY